jgi:glycosyltransferase involved in cell wall biosynthesis
VNAPAGDPRPPVIFVVFQTGNRANGGVESVTQIIERVRRLRPVVVTQMRTPVNDRWSAAGAEVHVWPLGYAMGSPARGVERVSRVWSMAETNRRMSALVRKTGARVVHCNDISALMHTVLGARAAGARVIQNVRDTKPAGEPWTRRWPLAHRLCARTVVLSREMRASIVAGWGLSAAAAERVTHAYSVVDLARMSAGEARSRAQARERLGIHGGRTLVAYVATLNAKKAQLEFIRNALPSLVQRIPGLMVDFVGDFLPERNPYAAACSAAVRELGLEEHARFVGYSSEPELWYRAADLLVLASRQEGLARCMIEGIACGTPMVSFDVCSAREILEQHGCGLVVPQGDYASLVDAVARVATDDGLRAEMSAAALRTRRLFEPGAACGFYEDMYLELSREGVAA